ncbi:MAG: hypothetical protein APF76_04105 [Desulfitibacter sp. BRH_c19]|nr:MAG: hypothetical protein APF76_04105 [Desulfitibacter sp. BRH_c19]
MFLNEKQQVLKAEIENSTQHMTSKLKSIMSYNQEKVLDAFLQHNISDFHFHQSTGYGYGDSGRDVLEKVFAHIFKTEDALVRPNIISGTHAIYLALKSILSHGDCFLTIGKPYDTLQKVIGLSGDDPLSLINQGIVCNEVPFDAANNFSILEPYLKTNPKVVFIQRSRGYTLRNALNVEEMGLLIEYIRKKNKDIYIVVDNCYGEFVERLEPSEVGADLVAGSLIKNPGGGLAPSGGYLVGKKKLIERAVSHLTAPGLGKDIGSSSIDKRLLFQGIFLAPMIVMQALETAIFAAKLFSDLDYKVSPTYGEARGDIIQAIVLQNEKKLLDFCRAVQKYSPVDSIVTPEPGELPGYDTKVIMAAGTFVQGASIELSADAPLKEPFVVYVQGSLVAEHGKIVLLKVAEAIKNNT